MKLPTVGNNKHFSVLTHFNSNMARIMVAHNFLLTTPTKSLPPPFSKYHGKKIKVLGSFWPGGPESDKQKLFTILVIDSHDKYKASNEMSRSIFY